MGCGYRQTGIFKFKCYRLVEDKASTTGFTAVPYKIPAGPYNFYMGFNGSRSQVNATFYLNGKKIPKCESGPIPSSTMKGPIMTVVAVDIANFTKIAGTTVTDLRILGLSYLTKRKNLK